MIAPLEEVGTTTEITVAEALVAPTIAPAAEVEATEMIAVAAEAKVTTRLELLQL